MRIPAVLEKGSVLLLFSLLSVSRTTAAGAIKWTVHGSQEVMVGGGICLAVEATPLELADLTIEVEGHDAMKIGRGSFINHGRQRLHLLFVDTNEKAVRRAAPRRVQFPPLFGEPGEVRITLNHAGVPLGTRLVRVLPATEKAVKANQLLYSEIDLDSPLSDRERQISWQRAFLSASAPSPVDRDTLAWMRESVSIVSAHPDWREAAPIVLARTELACWQDALNTRTRAIAPPSMVSPEELRRYRAAVASVITEEDSQQLEGISRRIEDSQPHDPFARALRDRVRLDIGILQQETRTGVLSGSSGPQSRRGETASSPSASSALAPGNGRSPVGPEPDPHAHLSPLGGPAGETSVTTKPARDARLVQLTTTRTSSQPTSRPAGTPTRIELTTKIRSTQPAAQPTTKPSAAATK